MTMPGATLMEGGRARFRVWAPGASRVEVRLVAPEPRVVQLQATGCGYHEGIADGVAEGALYRFALEGERELPDPASTSQPEGVHGPSEVIDTSFAWRDAGWRNPPLDDYVIYELHVGTFTPEGTLDSVQSHLAGLRDLGITALEIMPVAQFSGARNWGYDGVYPYAVQNTYGGPARDHPAFNRAARRCMTATAVELPPSVVVRVGDKANCRAMVAHHFGASRAEVPEKGSGLEGTWRRLLDSAGTEWRGPGSLIEREFEIRDALRLPMQPYSTAVLERAG